MLGPVFTREAVTAPRRPRLYGYRSIYVGGLLVLMITAWSVLTGTQIIRDVGDMARFGAILFQNIMAPVQLAVMVFLSALTAASGVAQEKDRRTLILLLMTRISNRELVLGKLAASLLHVLTMLLAGLPVFLSITLFGGVSWSQVGQVFLVTLVTALAAGSVGSVIALWRDKTFQTLAITALVLLMWLGVGEAVQSGWLWAGGWSAEASGAALSPLRAVLLAARPNLGGGSIWPYVGVALAVTAALNGWAIARVRVWNPSREIRPGQQDEAATIWGAEHDAAAQAPAQQQSDSFGAAAASQTAGPAADRAERSRQQHVDARVRAPRGKSRRVWDNPILWREVRTWAYGRKVLIIRAAYWLLFCMVAAALYLLLTDPAPAAAEGLGARLPTGAVPLALFFLLSLVIINALAVTSITNERDLLALDLLLVTDLSPKEFVFGKLLGVFWVTKEMVLLPMALCVGLWAQGAVSGENVLLLLGGLLVLEVFVSMLGIHCGISYANSRSAIGVSLGTVFFLFLGVVTCMAMMISFHGSFQTQLAPFLAFIGGGAVGLFVALGIRNPSSAIGWASLLLPFATFHAITSFVLGHMLSVFFVAAAIYGFTTAAMLMPAIGEFDIAMGRTKQGAHD